MEPHAGERDVGWLWNVWGGQWGWVIHGDTPAVYVGGDGRGGGLPGAPACIDECPCFASQ
eukprot:751202-Hanusia_phi.AAC.3